jgi:nicotinamidase/pyrazinamidase
MSFASNYRYNRVNRNKEPFTEIDLKQDNHEFKQMLWPDHCIQGTYGAEISPLLENIHYVDDEGSPKQHVAKIILKGKDVNNRVDSYSAFGDEFHGQYEKTELEYLIKMKKIERLIVVGLATDYCVGSTAIDAKHYFPEMEVILIEDCMRGVNPTTTEAKIKLMREKGCIIFKTVKEFMRIYEHFTA